MCLLKSYSFEKDFDLDIWGLFKDANSLGSRLDYTLEIVDAAMDGKIDLEQEFKLKAYINEIRRTREMEDSRKAKYIVPIVDDSDDWDDTSGVSSDRLSDFIDRSDAYEKLIDDCELQYAVETLISLRGHFLVEAKCDVIGVIGQALKGIPDSIMMLKELCEEYPVAEKLLKIILGSGRPFEELFSYV